MTLLGRVVHSRLLPTLVFPPFLACGANRRTKQNVRWSRATLQISRKLFCCMWVSQTFFVTKWLTTEVVKEGHRPVILNGLLEVILPILCWFVLANTVMNTLCTREDTNSRYAMMQKGGSEEEDVKEDGHRHFDPLLSELMQHQQELSPDEHQRRTVNPKAPKDSDFQQREVVSHPAIRIRGWFVRSFFHYK